MEVRRGGMNAFMLPYVHTFRACFADGYDDETQWAKLQNGAQMKPCSGATREEISVEL